MESSSNLPAPKNMNYSRKRSCLLTQRIDCVEEKDPRPSERQCFSQTFLVWLKSELIRVLHQRYYAYCRELEARAAQLTGENPFSEKPCRAVGLIFCVYADPLESTMDCGLTSTSVSVKALTNFMVVLGR